MKHAEVIKTHKASMIETFKTIFLKFNDKIKEGLISYFKPQILNKNWLWCRVAKFLYAEILEENIQDSFSIYKELTREIRTEENKLGFLHISQEFGDYINYDDIHGKFGHIEAIIISRFLLQHTKDIDVQVAEDFSRIQAMQPQTALSNK